MKKFIFTLAVMSLGSIIFVVGLRAQGIKEGKWSMTMVTKMGGMGDEMAQMNKEMENMSPEDAAMMQQMMGKMNMQVSGNSPGMTTTVTHCVSNQNPVPDMNTSKDCKETHTIDGNTVTFEQVCDKSKSTGEMTYENDSMTGTITSEQKENGQETKATIELTGEYLGPCDK